jgi:hypothetical protein
MQRRTRPSNIRRDTITGLPVIAPEGKRTGSRRSAPRVWNSLQRVLRPGSREQLTAVIGIALLLVTGTTFAVTRGPYNLALNAHSSGLQERTDRASTAPPATPFGTPLPSGYGPTLSDVSTPVISSPPADVTGEFCQQSYMFVPNISQWTVPPGCYATIYTPNPANFASRPGFGYCNWWVNEQHLKYADITSTNLPRSSTPKAGEAVWFNPGVQGASSAGHWAQLVAISPGGYWLLISEMNFSWRGAGFGKVDYRYIHVGAGILFVEG